MDEVSSYVRLDPLSVRRQGRPKDCSTSSSNPILEGPWCRFRREARARGRHQHRLEKRTSVQDAFSDSVWSDLAPKDVSFTKPSADFYA